MFSRLKSPEEERGVDVLKGYAVRTSKHEIKRFLRSMEYRRLPRHLKRIKTWNEDLLVLVDIVEECDPIDSVANLVEEMVKEGFGSKLSGRRQESLIETVSIPKYQPLTDSQYVESAKLWPCIRSCRFEEELDDDYIGSMVRVLKTKRSMAICTGACIIADGKQELSIHEDTDNVLGHSILKAVEEVSKAQILYLCTGFDAFILKEPCLSCSMALVHGRIKRVFCLKRDPEGPFSRIKINYNKNLNHRYPVYFMDETCADCPM
ncbi:uncharacterized protein Eint_090960 [Encephalitozoon intestinalis ATCC 50506]|uniref:Uncharacterized protein n=1 Tax=Encephalitozoon intestinalis (strain ATCC 50506) TaxID=876142 RepID=E0S8V9_ENCIT|nr:uncharacterized protein Eint_090960 [Encephalitozoon intestinalis ATCC 50506]ADM12225.1 hypothetical protein Eint_090960 [Encephalitozoon intestinalis ATCC 50506]UTX46034.1 hypothetical protein GPK93_09g16200 [Encephalitozoon intestinalis]